MFVQLIKLIKQSAKCQTDKVRVESCTMFIFDCLITCAPCSEDSHGKFDIHYFLICKRWLEYMS